MVEIAKVFVGALGWCFKLKWSCPADWRWFIFWNVYPYPIRCAPLAVIWICLKIGYSQIYRFIIVFLIFFLLNCHIFVACRCPPFFRHTYLLVTGGLKPMYRPAEFRTIATRCVVSLAMARALMRTLMYFFNIPKGVRNFRPTYLYGRVVGFNKYWTRGLTHRKQRFRTWSTCI